MALGVGSATDARRLASRRGVSVPVPVPAPMSVPVPMLALAARSQVFTVNG